MKLWCPKTGRCLSTLHGHQGTVMQCQWNANGNWVLTASRDQSCKVRARRGGEGERWAAREQGQPAAALSAGLGCRAGMADPILLASRSTPQVYDIRMQRELSSYRGHNRDVTYAAWHPFQEELFVSGAAASPPPASCRCSARCCAVRLMHARHDLRVALVCWKAVFVAKYAAAGHLPAF